MVSVLGLVGVGAVVAVVAWLLLRGAPEAAPSAEVRWEVTFQDGQVVGFEGAFPPPSWRDVQEVAQARGTTGTLSVRADGAVVFSETVPEGDRQRYRNILAPRFVCSSGPEG